MKVSRTHTAAALAPSSAPSAPAGSGRSVTYPGWPLAANAPVAEGHFIPGPSEKADGLKNAGHDAVHVAFTAAICGA